MGSDMEVDYCSFETNIVGVLFYPGLVEIKPMMRVLLEREPENVHDPNFIVAKVCDTRTMLGHLDRKTAAVIAPLLDNYPGLILKT